MFCLGRSRGQNPQCLRPLGFWPWDLPRHNIHHDTSSAFSNNVPMYSAIYGTVFSKMYINKYISFLKEEVSSTRNLDVCVQYSVYYGIQLAYTAVYSKL